MRKTAFRRVQMWITVIGVSILTVTMVGAVSDTAVASAPRASAASSSRPHFNEGTPLSAATVNREYKGTTLGPNSETGYGQAKYVWLTYHSGNRFTLSHTVKRYANPAGTRAPASCVSGIPCWNDMAHWQWPDIFGNLWSAVKGCVNGVYKGWIGSVAGDVASRFLFYTAAIAAEHVAELTPQGFVAGTIGSCTYGIAAYHR